MVGKDAGAGRRVPSRMALAAATAMHGPPSAVDSNGMVEPVAEVSRPAMRKDDHLLAQG
jgi:hypothetical protein